jgi:hypothetical protein
MRHRRPWAALLLVSAIAAGPACDRKMALPAGPGLEPPATMPPAPERLQSLGYTNPAVAQGRAAAAVAQPAGSGAAGALQAMAAARKLIRTAHLQIEVARYEEAALTAERIAEEHGGYLADSQAERGDKDRQQGTIALRIPADRFSPALAALKELGRVRSETVKTDDVTKAYADLETRLNVKRDTAGRLREILRTRTAQLSELLEAERELARITEQIEQMEGERRFFDQQAALSTVSLALYEPQALVQAGVFAPVGGALRDSLTVLANSLAGLIYAVVFLTPWLLIAYGVWRIIRARRARRRVTIAPTSGGTPDVPA